METKPRSRFLRVLTGFLYLGFLAVALAGGTAAGWVNRSPEFAGGVKEFFSKESAEEVFQKDSLTLLLLGCDVDIDERTKKITRKQSRSDMMLVARIDFKTKRITGLSIPRDVRCDLPGYRPMKMNAYHAVAKAGEESSLTERAVEHLLGGVGVVDIDRVLTIDYDEFQELVDIVGGVPVDIDKDMDYDDYAGNLHVHFKQGRVVLDGLDAMGFVRFRHSDDDFHRQARQKQFLVSFKQQVVKNLLRLPEIASKAPSVLGNTLSTRDIVALAKFGKEVKPDDIKLEMIPVVDGEGSFLEVNRKALKKKLVELGFATEADFQKGER